MNDRDRAPSTSAAALFIDEDTLRAEQHHERARLILLSVEVIGVFLLLIPALALALVTLVVIVIAGAAILSSVPATIACCAGIVLTLTLAWACGVKRSSTSSGSCVPSSR